MESKKTMLQSQVTVKISDDEYMQNQIILPFTLEILPNVDKNPVEQTMPEPELKNNEKLEFFIKADKSEYSHGNKITITGQIPSDDFNPVNAKNIKFSITSPEKNVIIAGEFAPNLDGSFTYDVFAMNKIWKTDGDYIFNLHFNSIVSNLIIHYDNTEFENSPVEPITPPVVEPIYTEVIIPECGVGTEDVNGICQVIQTKDESKGGGCLIATATYGSEMSIEVQQLRELRDNQLLQTQSGSVFMGTFNDIYYSFSPTIADMEREHPMFKEAVKLAITPMISILSLMENANSETEVLGLGLSVIALNLGMYIGLPAFGIVKVIQFRKN